MGGKRKKNVPQRADESKRQLMTWNMSELTPSEVHIVPDCDPSSVEEQVRICLKNITLFLPGCTQKILLSSIIISTGCIWWIVWFSVCNAATMHGHSQLA